MTEQTASVIPEGYMQNSLGDLTPIENVREQDKLRDSVVNDLAAEAIDLNKRIAAYKEKAFSDVADLIAIAAEKYDVKIGGKKGNVGLKSYDGQYKVQRTYAKLTEFTEEIEAAKQLIMNCIDRWSEGANNNIKALINDAFKMSNNGQLKTQPILALMKLEMNDPEWELAMVALGDAIQVNGTASYINVYKRVGQSNQYQIIPLSLAAV